MIEPAQQFQKALLLLDRGNPRGVEELRAVVARTDAAAEVAIASRVCLADVLVGEGALDQASELLDEVERLAGPANLDDVLDFEFRRARELRSRIAQG